MPSYAKESRQISLNRSQGTNNQEISFVGQEFTFRELISRPQSFFDDKIFEILYEAIDD